MSEELEIKSQDSVMQQSQSTEGGREGYTRPSSYQREYQTYYDISYNFNSDTAKQFIFQSCIQLPKLS